MAACVRTATLAAAGQRTAKRTALLAGRQHLGRDAWCGPSPRSAPPPCARHATAAQGHADMLRYLLQMGARTDLVVASMVRRWAEGEGGG